MSFSERGEWELSEEMKKEKWCIYNRKESVWEQQGKGRGKGEWNKRWGERELTFLMSSRPKTSGERPPWTQRNCWFMMAASGRQSNESIHVSYTVSEYLILPAKPTGHSQYIIRTFRASHTNITSHIQYLNAFTLGSTILIAEMCTTYMLCIHWHSSVVQ